MLAPGEEDVGAAIVPGVVDIAAHTRVQGSRCLANQV
jgi:hypothetical protein